MPKSMLHFDSDFDAIVNGTYSQLYGGTDIDSYSLYKISGDRIVDSISWYKEDQLTLLSKQDINKAEEMIEQFNFKQYKDGEDDDELDEENNNYEAPSRNGWS
jgi:hypothetical protein